MQHRGASPSTTKTHLATLSQRRSFSVFREVLAAPRRLGGHIALPRKARLHGLKVPKTRCGLTLRSSGPPPARHLGREAASYIIRSAAQAPCRWQPLSSNVRRHRHLPCVTRKASLVIERIYTRSPGTGANQEHRSVMVKAGAGIEGDRYFDRHDEPGQNITLIEVEELERFNAEHNSQHDPSVTGRNLVTRGVKLNALLGKEFTVGSVRFRGVELCEPCLGFGEALASNELTPPQVVKEYVNKCGLRADVLSSGEIAIGANVAGAA